MVGRGLLLLLLQQPGHLCALGCCMCREMEELTFFDSGPKPDWTKEKSPGYGRLDFLRPGERGDLCRGGLWPVFVCQTVLASASSRSITHQLSQPWVICPGSAPAHSRSPPSMLWVHASWSVLCLPQVAALAAPSAAGS